ncbi:hypothetical protein F4819DRAFT_96909 [Hypoxylon fuscum]|nr:hypothetical protein F4819DRAFT_96909 [Hypoxylon fuscum]
MPGLTLNTNGVPAPTPATTPAYPPSTTAIPPPIIPAPNPSASASAGANNPQTTPARRSSSPRRPTYSPITPPLNPVALPPRPAYTHSSQKDQTAIQAPPPEPIDFDSNPDVLALKSAISILQLQRRKAQADMTALDRAKTAALAEPDEFLRDLTEGRVGVEGDRLFVGGVRNGGDDEREDDSDSSDSDSSDSDAGMGDAENGAAASLVNGQAPVKTETTGQDVQMADASRTAPLANHAPPNPNPDPNPRGAKRGAVATDGARQQPRPWAKLPKPQSVVRCPPINWSQYAVVGESLDKLHNEQLSQPTQGTPAAVTSDGRYEFKGDGKQEKLVGVATPYAPGKDRLDKKPRV